MRPSQGVLRDGSGPRPRREEQGGGESAPLEHSSEGPIPHHAFRVQTPYEVYFGKGDEIPDPLAEARAEARARRMKANRARQCGVCA